MMLINTKEYLKIVTEIKQEITSAQQRVILKANSELMAIYWKIGTIINNNAAYGNKFIPNLARDIKVGNPKLRGFSERNLHYMAKFANVYKDLEILQQVAAKLSWRHHQTLLNRIKDVDELLWYAKENIEHGWSSNVLDMQIDRGLYKRQVLADKTTNFKDKLPTPQGELAQQTLKDPYIFDFIENHEGIVEREIENSLVGNITQFLLELGTGFSFVGQQYHMEIGDQDFYIDLLFYNLKLRCYVVIELKANEFKPDYAGQLNFYVSAVDSILKHEDDNPTIGILLCKKKNKVVAEYALRNINSPISVNEFKLFDRLPKEFENILPTVEDIENRLDLAIFEEEKIK